MRAAEAWVALTLLSHLIQRQIQASESRSHNLDLGSDFKKRTQRSQMHNYRRALDCRRGGRRPVDKRGGWPVGKQGGLWVSAEDGLRVSGEDCG